MHVLDKSRWPIVVITHGSQTTDSEFQAFLTDLDGLIAQGERYVYIDVQPEKVALPTISRLRRLSNWYRDNSDACERFCVGTACVIPSAAARGALKVFLDMSGARQRRYLANDLDDALNWAEARLSADRRRTSSSLARVSIPPRDTLTFKAVRDPGSKIMRTAGSTPPKMSGSGQWSKTQTSGSKPPSAPWVAGKDTSQATPSGRWKADESGVNKTSSGEWDFEKRGNRR